MSLLKRLNWCWRLVATGISFIVFGIGGLVLWAIVFPCLSLAVKNPILRSRLARKTIHNTFRFFVNLMKTLGVLSYEVHGLDKLNRSGLLILANHPTLIDVVFLISFTPKADCVVKASLINNPFTRGPVLAARFIRNNMGPPMLDDCIASVRQGNHLIIFPEGTRTTPGQPLRLQRGAANVAVRGHIPITPVVIDCHPSTLTKDKAWWQIPSKRPHFRLTVQDDLPTAALVKGCANDSLAARKLTDYLTDYFTPEPSNEH
jgi:1-acyl-sn-glycerol-3-phosphate acyltransferase